MAENKASFVLYTDLIHTVKKLSLEKAGELFMVILNYVNDNNPDVEDPIVDLVFEPIKHQLKRDLIAWEQTKGERSKAGKASAEARRLSKELEIKQLKSNKSQHVLTGVDFVEHDEQKEQMSTNSTVNVNVTVTDNVNDNVILNKEASPIFLMPRPNAFGQYKDLSECVVVMKNEIGWHSVIAMSLGIPTVNHVIKWVEKFDLYAQSTGWTHTNISEAKKYFRNWLSLELKKGVTLDTVAPGAPALKAEGSPETPTERRNRLRAEAQQQQQQQNAGN